jgi:glucokinase
MLLAGDIGGTKTVLALYEEEASPTAPLSEQTYPSGRYDSLERIVEQFLQSAKSEQEKVEREPIRRATFGVAGPVVGGKATLPNLPWVIEEANLQEAFDFEAVDLINDLRAIGHAVPVLPDGDLATVKEGTAEPGGNIAVIAPGTGLGETFLSWDGGRCRVHPSEGGHADFAPVNDLQMGLLQYLLERFEHVSYERVCSGMGVPNLYAYLKDSGQAEEPDWLSKELARAKDPNAVIMGAATGGTRECRICTLTLELFVSILAAEAGNLVLRHMATGGLFFGGGIPPRILSFLEKPLFAKWFGRKGRLSRLPEKAPVRVILNSKVALVGAASFALQEVRGRQ